MLLFDDLLELGLCVDLSMVIFQDRYVLICFIIHSCILLILALLFSDVEGSLDYLVQVVFTLFRFFQNLSLVLRAVNLGLRALGRSLKVKVQHILIFLFLKAFKLGHLS